MEKILKLYTYQGEGIEAIPFPNAEEQVVITDFQYDANRMGSAPSISAKIMHRLCLDDLWTDNVYAEFNGEKYFVMNTPSSNKDNDDTRYEHDIELLSEREVLNHVYFIDAVQGDSTVDVYKSNSTKVIFMGDINEFASRLNSSLSYTKVGYNVVVDEGIVTEAKLVSFEDKYIMSALQEIFNIYEVPYYFVGKTIHIGYTDNAIPNVFKYGFEDALLSISKDNANYEVVRRCTGIGSSDNIPYYYPNNSPKGDASIRIISGSLSASQIIITDYEKFVNKMSPSDVCSSRTEQDEQGITRTVWSINGEDIELSDIGLRLADNVFVAGGVSFGQDLATQITYASNLMPPIYRETFGAERFYNAENDTYPSPEGGYYTFENLYSTRTPNEKIVSFEDIKPSIVGMTNASGQRIDQFIDIAFDTNDNDEIDEEGNYVHPYFFVKLPKYNGSFGFNLFDHAIENGTMQISMTNGVCGACTFEIGVGDETQKNIVQVDENGNLKRDENGNVLWENQTPQDRQNDTQNYEVWIALKKDDSTYGQIMPNASQNLKPSVGDTFVILNISLPQSYILAAEEKLKDSIIKYMFLNNNERFTFSVNFSRIYFAENPDVLALMNENARILIEYNGKQHTLYISSFSYKMSKDNPLPEISIDLTDELSVGQNSLQNALDAVKNDILSSIGGGDFLKQGLKYFLRKDTSDTARGKITFLKEIQSDKGIEFGKYTTGALGSGGAVLVDENGHTHAEFDYLSIRKKALFTEITVQELKHIGGALIISPAAMIVSKVEETTNGYKCYFESTDDDGRKVYNEFEVGDQGRCQTFNLEKQSNGQLGNRYWWRLVTEIGDDYVVFSKTDADQGSDIPQVGDEVCQLGNRTDKTRQNAQIYSAYGSDSPSRKMYQGIDSYSLEGKVIKDEYYDVTSGRFKEVTYGDFYVGDEEEQTYVKYDQEEGVNIKGNVTITKGSGWENLDGLKTVINDATEATTNAKEAADAAKQDAEEAKQDAADASNRLDEWASDGAISPTEKLTLKQELANLQSEYETNVQNAEKYGVSTSSYTSAWNAYKTELTYHSADTPENITIRPAFKTSQSTFYTERQSLLDNIAMATKEYADKILESISVGAENILLNTGFTGEYMPRELKGSTGLSSKTMMYSDRLIHWTGSANVIDDTNSTSGYAATLGSLSQAVKLINSEKYTASVKAKNGSLTLGLNSDSVTFQTTGEYKVYSYQFTGSANSIFKISGSATVCEIKLERGTVRTDWCPSRKDKDAVADEFKKYWYLMDALKGSTGIYGGLILTSMIQLGKWTNDVLEKVNAGISGIYNDDTDVALWAGGTFEEAIKTVQKLISGDIPTDEEWKSMAKFVATHGGDVFLKGYIYAMGGVFRGTVYAKDGLYEGIVKAKAVYTEITKITNMDSNIINPNTHGNYFVGEGHIDINSNPVETLYMPTANDWTWLNIKVRTQRVSKKGTGIILKCTGTDKFSLDNLRDSYSICCCLDNLLSTFLSDGTNWIAENPNNCTFSNDMETWYDYQGNKVTIDGKPIIEDTEI